MKRTNKTKRISEEYENLPPEEKKKHETFEDYLGANAQGMCERCDNVFEYDELDEDGHCCNCSESEEDDDECDND